MTRSQRQANALTKAKSWRDRAVAKFFILQANNIKHLTDMQWWRLQEVHGSEFIEAVREDAEKVVRS